MRRFSYKKYLILAAFLFLLVLLPTFFIEKMRVSVVSLISPFWSQASNFKPKNKFEEECLRLQTENQLLKIDLLKLKGMFSEMQQKIPETTHFFVANVIYRDPTSWSSSFWVDVGDSHIEKNSPVLSGRSLVGVVDFVGKKQARIRLLTDSALHPSVRCNRRENGLSKKSEGWYLAKGILQGAGEPLWRSKGSTLRGIGFNYDFPDEKGTATKPIIQVGDLLVTTGMDGVFPPDLQVATVTKVFPLKEGAFSYEIEAKPTAHNLDELKRVIIIPPISRMEDENCYSK